MSSLWTPDGERRVERPKPPSAPMADEAIADGEIDPAMAQAELDALREQLGDTEAWVVVANHCYGLFELAALYLSLDPPRPDQAAVVIDALAGVLSACAGRLGEPEPQLLEGLHNLQVAFVQIASVRNQATEAPPA